MIIVNIRKRNMKIKSINLVGKKKVFDISVKDAEHYVLENGIVTHNTGAYYSANNIYVLGRQQEKEGNELVGYNFIINVEKSRFVKAKSKLPVTCSQNSGISTFSGLLELALESGHIIKPSNGWYSKVDSTSGEIEDKKYREKDTNSREFWSSILKQNSFYEFVKDKYLISDKDIISADDDMGDFEYEVDR